MKTRILTALLIVAAAAMSLTGCGKKDHEPLNVRTVVDTVGFPHTAAQTDSVMNRISRLQGDVLEKLYTGFRLDSSTAWKTVICPHDDYAYAGYLYPLALRHIRAGTVLMFGVAHKAKQFGIEDRLVFGTYDAWKGPYGNVPVSDLRDAMFDHLPAESWVVSDSLMAAEHSLEAMIPILQYFNPRVRIVPVLVPAMQFERMQDIASMFAFGLAHEMEQRGWTWGRDLAILISSDAVHYGDRDWGGKNLARYGADDFGYARAVEHETKLVGLLAGRPDDEKIEALYDSLVQKDDFRQYRWTWCGRYSVPFGMLTAEYLQDPLQEDEFGRVLAYGTSIGQSHIPVADLGMGTTAPATIRHWVGYAVVAYK
jgi:AmmeMemoRadiSam system protein B